MEDPRLRQGVERLKAGDIDGLAPLVEALQVRALRAAYLITQDKAQAEDIVQSMFVRLARKADLIDTARPVTPYVLRMVVNDALMHMRGRGRTISFEGPAGRDAAGAIEDVLRDDAELPEDAAERQDVQGAVANALKQLSPDQRAAIVLRYYLGLSEAEMTDRLDVPTGTVKWRLHAARKHLRYVLRPIWAAPAEEDQP
ncbi:MAG: RNA polymerase sigma factor [Chloroflexi bacterium]|nr:RNA polymerase sigma factor [Chloroflexota bacterium]